MASKKKLYRNYLENKYTLSGLFNFELLQFGIVTKSEAILLMYLKYIGNLYSYREDDPDFKTELPLGWFPCRADKISEILRMDASTQSRTFRSLKKKGIIDVRRVGMPAKRYVALISGAVDEDAKKFVPLSEFLPK